MAALAIAAGCGQSPSPAPPVAFDGERAFADVRHLVETVGARRMGTPEAAATRAYIRGELEPLGWSFEEDPFEATAPEGANRSGTFAGVNLLARRAGTAEREIWLASHYDTLDKPGFVGANDGGSSTAVLLELGRQLGGSGPRRGLGLVLCWFDGEEPFTPVPWSDQTNSTFGSRHLVQRLKAAGALARIHCLVLLDMVGDRDLGLLVERASAGWLAAIFERTAHRLGHKQLFVGRQEIKDDHYPWIRAGVEAIDLIDFHYGPGHQYWHTREDTLDKVSAGSLSVVGKLVLAALPEIERIAPER